MKAAIIDKPIVLSPAREQRAAKLKQTVTYRHLVPVSTKPILPDGYRENLIRPLEAIEGLEVKLNPSLAKATPEVVWLNPRKAKILIDFNIQRPLEASDLRIIKDMGENFDWGQFKVPTLVEVPEWKMTFCVDGQKTTIAAMYNNLSIPFCKTIETPETYIKRQAMGFIGINFKRSVPRPDQLYSAYFHRGDENEIALAGILRKHGITPTTNKGGRIKDSASPLETTCINILRKLYAEKDKKTFDFLCKLIAGVKYKPIRRVHLDALNIISFRTELSSLNLDRMINAILSIDDKYAILLATTQARKMNSRAGMISRELADIYMSNYKKPVSHTSIRPY